MSARNNHFVPPFGPTSASVMLVGEAPGRDEVIQRQPFVGQSGQELTRMLHEAGILRGACFITNVARIQPPQNDIENFFYGKKEGKSLGIPNHYGRYPKEEIVSGLTLLWEEIHQVNPKIIIAFGSTALWALTGKHGINKWRGSQLVSLPYRGRTYNVVPVYHPAAVLRMWEWRATAVHDIRRAQRYIDGTNAPRPEWRFVVRPTIDDVARITDELLTHANAGPTELSVDIETRRGQIACIGFAWTELDALCVPLMCVESPEGYWSESEERLVMERLYKLLTHHNVKIIGQNFLYDSQYFAWESGFIPRAAIDTMFQQHVAFAGTPKSLDYLASIYCNHYVYWKDDGKEWDRTVGEEQLWFYNCEDCVRTLEVSRVLRKTIDKFGLNEVYNFQMSLYEPVMTMMLQGIKVDPARRNEFATTLELEINKRNSYIGDILGFPLNVNSSPQMKQLFYEDFKLPIQKHPKTKKPTLNDEALDKLAQVRPLLIPLIDRIRELRSLRVYKANFIEAELDPDGRMRCSFGPANTETYRFNSSTNAFGRGTNLQNIPRPDSDDDTERSDPNFRLPNVRMMFVPDEDYMLMDWDLERADAQVVAWEANDNELKQMFRERADIHMENAKVIWGATATQEHRQMAKNFVHGTNYGGSERTMARVCGITVKQAGFAQNRWFQAHPGIKHWHDDVMNRLMSMRMVSNKFGYRRFYFDRIETILPEALAWIPQSTVACVINRGLVNIYKNLPQVDLLLQVHDSLVMQVKVEDVPLLAPRIKQNLLITVPYDDPLTIDVNAKVSLRSWGEVEKMKL